jgi:hypothetical protein
MYVFEEFKHLVERDKSDEKSIKIDRVNGGGKIFQKMKP